MSGELAAPAATPSPPPQSPPHIVLFPFLSKGHMIPFIQLAHLLHRRGILLTLFTTPSNAGFVRRSLRSTAAAVVELPFPESFPGLPPGVESTDQLPSMSLFIPFVSATKLLHPYFDRALPGLRPPVTCVISDGFLPWTLESASKIDAPRLSFFGMNHYAATISGLVFFERPHRAVASDDEPFSVSAFPGIRLSKNDLTEPFDQPEPSGDYFDFVLETAVANLRSRGTLMNSFYELEPVYVDFWTEQDAGRKSWSVGPLCLAAPPETEGDAGRPYWMRWLDERDTPVLYVAFGSQAEVPAEQLVEIAAGLEESGVSFVWVLRGVHKLEWAELEERVEGRGLVVRDWVQQWEILRHERVAGFLSHCGWNSAMESLCAAVPVLAWPLMAEQFLNAKLLVEELGVALRVGERRRVVGRERVAEMVRELMVGVAGKKAAEKVKTVAAAARKAMEGGGSSWRSLDEVVNDVCRWKEGKKDHVG